MNYQSNVTKISSLLLLILASFSTQAQDLFSAIQLPEKPGAPIIANVDGRNTTSLNGTWNALIDPAVFSLNDMMHFAERNYKGAPSELVEVDVENGLTLHVPGDWNTQDDRLFFYNGKVWYKRDFYIKSPAANRFYLHFGAINYRAEVYVNGELAATHTGGYTSFNCEITELVKPGNNLLVVKVNNQLTNSDIPTTRTDWLNYGGITRDVTLVELPSVFVENYKIQLDKGDPNRIEGWVSLNGIPSGTVTVAIEELGLQQTVNITDGMGKFAWTARPQLWSPESPKLYEVRISHGEQTLTDHIGFRTVAVADRQVLLNGAPLFLRGISIHEEAIGAKGRLSSYEEALEILSYAKELNCNYVRLAHYTHNRHMLRAADELGLLVWAEIPVYWNLEFSNPKVLEMAKNRMQEMIHRDQNRASIIFWSLGNETPKSEPRTEFFRNLNDYVKSVDDTRLTTAALVFGGEEIQAMAKKYYFPAMQGQQFATWDIEIEDPLASIVDVAAVNQYFGWYYSGFLAGAAKMDAKIARQVMLDNISKIKFHIPNDKPFIFSEFGAGAKRGHFAEAKDLVVYSEEYQALAYQKQIEMIKQQEGLVGITPWVLKDFRSPMRLKQGVQDYWNLKGLISNNGERKKAFFVLQDYYAELMK